MPKFKVIIEIDKAIWDSIPAVARYLQLPSDAQSPAVCSTIFEHAMMELQFEAGVPAPEVQSGIKPSDALNELLDPNISLPLRELAIIIETNPAATRTLLDEFEELSTRLPTDQWILKVLTMPEGDQPYWKTALAAVYSVVMGPDRKLSDTWTLIERTYGLVRPKNLDKDNAGGNNTNSPT